MRITLTRKDFKKPITIENEKEVRTVATADEVIKFLQEVASGLTTFKEIVVTEKNITIKTKL